MIHKTRSFRLMSAAILAILFAAQAATADILTYQPGPEGKDTFLNGGGANGNAGDGGITHTWWDSGPTWRTWSLFEFDVSQLPASADVSSVKLKLYQSISRNYGMDYGIQDPTMVLYNVTSAWNEGVVTWNTAPGIDQSSTQGSFQHSFNINNPTSGLYTFFEGWIEFDITGIYNAWKDGSVANNGLAMRRLETFGENAIGHHTYTSDYTDDVSLRPMLVVDYVPEPASMLLLVAGGLALVNKRRRA